MFMAGLDIYGGMTPNDQMVGMVQMSINEWTDKQIGYIHTIEYSQNLDES